MSSRTANNDYASTLHDISSTATITMNAGCLNHKGSALQEDDNQEVYEAVNTTYT